MSLIAASTNYAAIVRPLQLLVMVIAILFFARVLRVAAVQSRPVDYEKRSRRRRALALEFSSRQSAAANASMWTGGSP